jgi:hypothetical protein
MTTTLLSHQYDPSLNHAAPLSRQNCQPRRSEAEPRWIVDRELSVAVLWPDTRRWWVTGRRRVSKIGVSTHV